MGSSAITWISCIVILLIFWLILIRPQRKKDKQIADMRKGVKAGDKIVTIGGIKGRVIKDKQESLILEVGDRVRMEVMRWAVSAVLEEGRGSIRNNKKAEEMAAAVSEKEHAEEPAEEAEASAEAVAEEAVEAVEPVEEEKKAAEEAAE